MAKARTSTTGNPDAPVIIKAAPKAPKAPKAVKAPKEATALQAAPGSAAATTETVALAPPKAVARQTPESRDKPKKAKLVRDSFTMPETEYAVLGELKKAFLKEGVEVKKSELLRVGVALLKKLDTAGIREVLATLPTLKAGRPKKGK